jgi:hypothetical protein
MMSYEKRRYRKHIRRHNLQAQQRPRQFSVLSRKRLLPFRRRRKRITCAFSCGAEEEGQNFDFDALGFEKGTEIDDVCETEPRVWGYCDESVMSRGMRLEDGDERTAVDVDCELAVLQGAHDIL